MKYLIIPKPIISQNTGTYIIGFLSLLGPKSVFQSLVGLGQSGLKWL